MAVINDFIIGRTARNIPDLPVNNTSANPINAGDVVQLDTANPLSTTQGYVGVTAGTLNAMPYGVAVQNIPAGGQGSIQRDGIAIVKASGAIAAGATVQCAANSQVQTSGAAQPQLGQALNATALAGDFCAVALAIAKNS